MLQQKCKNSVDIHDAAFLFNAITNLCCNLPINSFNTLINIIQQKSENFENIHEAAIVINEMANSLSNNSTNKFNKAMDLMRVILHEFDQVGIQDIKFLFDKLESHQKKPTLHFNSNEFDIKSASSLKRIITKTTIITEVNFRETKFNDDSISILTRSFQDANSIITIKFDIISISPKGAIELIRGFEGNIKLEHFFWCERKIDIDAATALANVIRTNPFLSILTLGDNELSCAETEILANAIMSNKALSSIRLFFNEIGDAGAIALAKALDGNGSLTELSLDENEIGDVGAEAFAEALKKNTTLTVLDLARNPIHNRGAAALADALEFNTTLTKLKLDRKNIDDKILKVIDGYLERNKMGLQSNTTLSQSDTHGSEKTPSMQKLAANPHRIFNSNQPTGIRTSEADEQREKEKAPTRTRSNSMTTS